MKGSGEYSRNLNIKIVGMGESVKKCGVSLWDHAAKE
jgi:hypothetical protein